MKRFKGKSLLRNYLISFVSIAMFSCAVIGMITYIAAAQELRISAQAEQQKRLVLAAEDMDSQIEQLQDIANRIQTSVYYMPSYFSRNAYYEVELIKDLQKYSNYSSLMTHYFIQYEGEESVFGERGKSFLDAYLRTYLDYDDAASLKAFIASCTKPGFFAMSDGTLAVYPVKMNEAPDYTGRAWVCFYLTKNVIIDRVRLVSGERFESVEIAYQDTVMVQNGEINRPVTAQGEKIALTFDLDEVGYHVGENFILLNVTLIGVFAALLCVLAVVVAVRSYRPIGNIARRHNLHGQDGNELEHIDMALNNMKGQLRLSQEQLDEKLQLLKAMRGDLQRHFTMSLVQGHADDAALGRMREAGMRFPGATFRVFMFKSEWPQEEIDRMVEELSDDDTVFYAMPFGGEMHYAVLANGGELDSAGDMLSDAVDAAVYGGKQTEALGEIPSLLFDALTQASPSYIKPSDIARCREDERLRKFRKALEIGDEATAITSLRAYFAAYAQDDEMLQQLIHNNATAVLLGASYEVNMSVPRAFLRGGHETWSLLEGWVSALCSSREKFSKHEEHQIIRYLREHALDYDLMLEGVAEHFHRSARQITRIIQAETGCSYKEFILRLRMEHAKRMLKGGKSVAETCEKVCYASRSHFIKTFTSYVGMTPSRYRDSDLDE